MTARARVAGAWWATVVAAVVIPATAGRADAQVMVEPQPTAIRFEAPAEANLGESVPVRATLTDAAGRGVAGATVSFSVTSAFLGVTGSRALAQSTADGEGVAAVALQLRSVGEMRLTASFAGDHAHAPSSAGATVVVTGTRTLHTEHAGVSIPGLTASDSDGFLGELSRRFAGWPIGALLLTIWGLYAYVVRLLFSVAAAPSAPGPSGGAAVGAQPDGRVSASRPDGSGERR